MFVIETLVPAQAVTLLAMEFDDFTDEDFADIAAFEEIAAELAEEV